MVTILTIIHILVCIFLVSIVLLQHGKGADIGATFGGGGESLFGTEGPVPIMNKITTAAAVIFMVTSISLAYMSAHSTTSSVMGDYSVPAPVEQAAPIAEALPERVPMPTTPYEEPAPAQFPGGQGGKASE
ncbi:preprotein translocase subunit SecG [Thermodesulfobacteriota bacterium]